LQDADQYLSKELLWKLYLDQAVYLEKSNKFDASRGYLKEAIYTAPDNLRWKAWVSASRVELRAGFKERAIKLLKAAMQEVPSKQRPLVLVEVSQAYELIGNIHRAREFMNDACEKSKMDWKIYLERINLEMRAGQFFDALDIVKEAVSKYFSTGRLWASFIQILHTDQGAVGKGIHFKAFLLAVQEVSKSGEVWCEGARIRMNPFSNYFDLDKAEEYLNYAVQFTPQYGDSFIELMRVLLLKGKLHKIKPLKRLCVNADPNYGTLWFYCKANCLEGPREVWKRAKTMIFNEVARTRSMYHQTKGKEYMSGQLWIGLAQNVWSFTRNYVLDFNAKAKLIYGSESLII
jgi:la-related protein 1